MNVCLMQSDLGEILRLLTLSTGFKALQLAFPFLGNKNEKEAVVSAVQKPR